MTNTAYAMSMAEYISQIQNRESIFDNLFDSVEVDDDEPLISAKNEVSSRNEAVLNPVNLIGDYESYVEHIDSIETEVEEQFLEALVDEGLAVYNERADIYELPEEMTEEEFEEALENNPELKNLIEDDFGDYEILIWVVSAVIVVVAAAIIYFSGGNPIVAAVIVPAAMAAINALLSLFGLDKPSWREVLKALGISTEGLLPFEFLGNTYYGGRIIFTFPCTCEPSRYMIILEDFKEEGKLILKYDKKDITQKLFNFKNIYTPANAILGSFTGTENHQYCRVEVGPFCVGIPVHGNLNSEPGTGTSLYPAF